MSLSEFLISIFQKRVTVSARVTVASDAIFVGMKSEHVALYIFAFKCPFNCLLYNHLLKVFFIFTFTDSGFNFAAEKMSDTRLFPYEEESHSDRLARKSKEAPIFPIGKSFDTRSI